MKAAIYYGKWDIEQMITHEYPLTELEQAIRKASDIHSALNVTVYFDERS